jgi:hypothetical protein
MSEAEAQHRSSAMPTIAWASGGTAPVIAFGSDDALEVDSSIAAAPGTPLAGRVTFASGEEHPLVLKVRRCKRTGEERFTIDGKVTSPTRALRAALIPFSRVLAGAQLRCSLGPLGRKRESGVDGGSVEAEGGCERRVVRKDVGQHRRGEEQHEQESPAPSAAEAGSDEAEEGERGGGEGGDEQQAGANERTQCSDAERRDGEKRGEGCEDGDRERNASGRKAGNEQGRAGPDVAGGKAAKPRERHGAAVEWASGAAACEREGKGQRNDPKSERRAACDDAIEKGALGTFGRAQDHHHGDES